MGHLVWRPDPGVEARQPGSVMLTRSIVDRSGVALSGALRQKCEPEDPDEIVLTEPPREVAQKALDVEL